MSLTEIVLSLAIMIAVIAGVAVNYASVKERNDEQQLMQGIEMLRSNIEQIYGHEKYLDISNTLLINAGAVPNSLLQSDSIKSPWGAITVSANGTSKYNLALENVPVSACTSLANLSTKSWDSVSIDDTLIFSRSENTKINPSTILSACNSNGKTVTFVGP